MQRSRMAVYVIIGIIALLAAYYVLVREPLPDWPINIIHLLFRH